MAAFITNISFPKSLDEVLYFLDERGQFDVEQILGQTHVEWTVPKSAKPDDTVFFMHSKTSIDTIKSLRRRLKKGEWGGSPLAEQRLHEALDHAEKLYAKIGGCVFAMGVVIGEVIVDRIALQDKLHWRSVFYAPIGEIKVFDEPLHISTFRDFIQVSRTGAITLLNEEQVEGLFDLAGI